MPRRKILTAEEQDVHTGWRHVMCSYQRAGATAQVKRRTNRRERREAHDWIKEQLNDNESNPHE